MILGFSRIKESGNMSSWIERADIDHVLKVPSTYMFYSKQPILILISKKNLNKKMYSRLSLPCGYKM